MKLIYGVWIAAFFCISFSVKAQKIEEQIALANAQLDSNHFYKAFDILQIASRKTKSGSQSDGRLYAEKAKVLDKGRLYGWYREMYNYPPAPGTDTSAIIATEDKNWENEMEMFTNWAIRGDKKYALAYEMRASLEISRKDFANAAQDLAKAMELDPNNCHAYFTRGNLYRNTAKWDSAVADLTKYIQCEPGNYSAHLKRSIGYAGLKQFDLALVDVNEALRLKPKSRDVSAVQIIIAHNKAIAAAPPNIIDFDKALETAKHIVQLFPGDTLLARLQDEIYYNRVRLRSASAKELISAIYKKDTKAALAAIPLIIDKSELDMDFPNPNSYRKEDHALTFAVTTKNYELAEALLKAGANPNVTSDRHESSLYSLAGKYDWSESDIDKMGRLLFLYKADPNIQDEKGNTALFNAITYEHVSYIKALIKNKINVNLKNDFGLSAISQLVSGTETGFIMAKILIDGGADVNIVNADKNRGPFMDASFRSPTSLQTIYLLVKAGVKEVYPTGKADFKDLKNFIGLLKREVIGKPTSQLFEAMIVQNIAKLKEALKKTAPSDSLINYLYIANMGGPYNPAIENELRHEGASDEFQMYDQLNGHYVSMESMKKERFSKPYGDGYEAYYKDELEEFMNLMDESVVSSNKLNNRNLIGTNNCGPLADTYNSNIKSIRILNNILANHDNSIYRLTEKRKAEVTEILASQRDLINKTKEAMSKYACSINGLLVE